MNRIILVGNGFDLAHGLKTSYKDFLDDYWQGWVAKLRACKTTHVSDSLCEFVLKNGDQLANGVSMGHLFYLLIMYINTNFTLEQIISKVNIEINSYEDVSQLCNLLNEYQEKIGNSPYRIQHGFTSQLFAEINSSYINKWVDIENEYYQLLKKTYGGNHSSYKTVEDLNDELNVIKDKLINYLRKIQKEKITAKLYNERIKEILFEPFRLFDISNSGQDLFWNDMLFQIEELPSGKSAGEIEEELGNHPEYSIMTTKEGAYRAMIKHKLENGQLKEFLQPGQTLLLNFNYTNTAQKLYLKSDDTPYCEVINIHGELKNSNNPIIFGYGDEMDEHYKKIVDLNNNGYLQNIKSIRYLETDNYRNLLSFIDSAPYQIYIMGHSCGNSDRTLLNTIFEHKNCISIKPYYYEEEDDKGNHKDNYIEIVQNIYRNFKDMALMRDKVVNKRYCEAMPQNHADRCIR